MPVFDTDAHVEESEETFAALARDIADAFTAADIAWLDAQLAGFGMNPVTYRASCREQRVDRGGDRVELRLECGEQTGELKLAAFVVLRGATVEDARVDTLAVGENGTVHRLEMAAGIVVDDGYPNVVRLALKESGAGLPARLLSGRRILELSIRSYGQQAIVRLETIDDLPALDIALESMAAADVFAAGPLRRRAVLSGLAHRFAEE